MRYAGYDDYEVTNGNGGGMSLYIQGCHFHCKNCFNKETWDFNSGKEWTTKSMDKFLKLTSRPYIKRISLLGGEPLAKENLVDVLKFVNEIRISFGQTKKIRLYTGYSIENLFTNDNDSYTIRRNIISSVDVLVDGQYEDSLKDPTLLFRGSSNQRIWDIPKTIKTKKLTLWEPNK